MVLCNATNSQLTLTKAKVAGQRGGLAGDTLLEAPITAQNEGVMVNDVLESSLVVDRSKVLLGQSHTNSVRQTLSKRSSGHLHTGSDHILGVAGGKGAQLAELSQILDTEVVARQVKHGIQKSTRVSVGKNEAVAVGPLGVLRRIVHELREKNVSDGSATHGSSGVARVGFLDHVRGQDTNGINASSIKRHDSLTHCYNFNDLCRDCASGSLLSNPSMSRKRRFIIVRKIALLITLPQLEVVSSNDIVLLAMCTARSFMHMS